MKKSYEKLEAKKFVFCCFKSSILKASRSAFKDFTSSFKSFCLFSYMFSINFAKKKKKGIKITKAVIKPKTKSFAEVMVKKAVKSNIGLSFKVLSDYSKNLGILKCGLLRSFHSLAMTEGMGNDGLRGRNDGLRGCDNGLKGRKAWRS